MSNYALGTYKMITGYYNPEVTYVCAYVCMTVFHPSLSGCSVHDIFLII